MSEDLFSVKPHIRERAHIKTMEEYQRLYRLSLDNPEWFWGEQAKSLTWFHPWQSVFDADYKEVDFSWFSGGRLNACFNCVDRHLPHLGDKTALIWAQDEPGVYTHITYRDLKHQVARVANVLLHNGVKKGDRVCIYLTMIPELVYTMLACARIGAVHSVVFGGFSAESLRDRIVDAHCKVVVTANEGLRGGKRVPLKRTVDRAIEGMSLVETVLVARRTDGDVPMQPGRDLWLDEETAKQRSTCTNEWMGAEDPLFILYTSGSTGKPKGLLHTTGGYLTYAAFTHKLVFDYHPDDIYFCAADVGWVTGHSYIVYGPLANGATSVIFESTPLYPDAGRYWQIVDDLGVNILYTAPTALRALAQAGDSWIHKYSRKSLRILGTVGEPINPEVWRWYHDVVGEGRCTVVDTWWQTETGGILISPLPGVDEEHGIRREQQGKPQQADTVAHFGFVTGAGLPKERDPARVSRAHPGDGDHQAAEGLVADGLDPFRDNQIEGEGFGRLDEERQHAKGSCQEDQDEYGCVRSSPPFRWRSRFGPGSRLGLLRDIGEGSFFFFDSHNHTFHTENIDQAVIPGK